MAQLDGDPDLTVYLALDFRECNTSVLNIINVFLLELRQSSFPTKILDLSIFIPLYFNALKMVVLEFCALSDSFYSIRQP